jgi:16S rRNA (cytidine1402-2'-O)-methyltransferase
MSGTLFVVATPIGNLEDVTFRALRVLREVALIAAEDTRRTNRLLQHYSISTPTTSLHEHNEHRKTPLLVERLQKGESIALVSDAGTPLISDPGARLVAAAHAAAVRVEPIPGATAVMAALSASGFDSDQFVFLGFPPAKGKARSDWFARLRSETRTLVLYEAPHRIRDTLTRLLEYLGDRPILMARELTKVHEQLVVRPISALLKDSEEGRGEYTLVVSREHHPAVVMNSVTEADIYTEFWQLTEFEGLARRDAVRELATRHGLPGREVYRRIESGKKERRMT